MKEAGKVDEIIAVSIGPAKSAETVRYAIAMGATRGVHIVADDELPPLVVAKILKAVQDKEKADVILMGKQAIDDDAGQTPQLLATLSGYGQATYACKIDFDGDSALLVQREVESGIETVKVNLPAVVSCDLRLNQPRFATLQNIMKAKKAPFESIKIADLGVSTESGLKMVGVAEPPVRKAGIMVSSVDELLGKLKSEAKVL